MKIKYVIMILTSTGLIIIPLSKTMFLEEEIKFPVVAHGDSNELKNIPNWTENNRSVSFTISRTVAIDDDELWFPENFLREIKLEDE